MRDWASVAVVGAGVVGCSLVLQLAERGVGVLVVERGTVCSEMTARSGAVVRVHDTSEPGFKRRPRSARAWPSS